VELRRRGFDRRIAKHTDAYIPREMTLNQSIQSIPVLLQRVVLVLVLVVVVSTVYQSEDFQANTLLGTHLTEHGQLTPTFR
jgi:hypothetical protein